MSRVRRSFGSAKTAPNASRHANSDAFYVPGDVFRDDKNMGEILFIHDQRVGHDRFTAAVCGKRRKKLAMSGRLRLRKR